MIQVLAGIAPSNQTIWSLLKPACWQSQAEFFCKKWVLQKYFNGKLRSVTFDRTHLAKVTERNFPLIFFCKTHFLQKKLCLTLPASGFQ
jgi:hypothetical protein